MAGADHDVQAQIAAALVRRTRCKEDRALKLASAYLDAARDRAVATTVASELPPTAMKSAQIALLISLLGHFKDVPTRDELAALLRITSATAGSLLNEVLAASDDASAWLLRGVFERAEKSKEQAGKNAAVPDGYEWRLASASDLALAKSRLEFFGVQYKTVSSSDGAYVLLIEKDFEPENPG